MPGLSPFTVTAISSLWGPDRHSREASSAWMMLCLVLCQRRRNVRRRTQWVLHGFHGLIRQSQLSRSPEHSQWALWAWTARACTYRAR